MSSLADYFTNQIQMVGFDRLFGRCVREMGLNSASWNPQGDLGETICDYMTDRLRKAYEHDWWPVLTPVVKRVVREDGGKFVPWQQNPSLSASLYVVGSGVEGVDGEYSDTGSLNGKNTWTRVGGVSMPTLGIDGDSIVWNTSTGPNRWELYKEGEVIHTNLQDVDIPVGAWGGNGGVVVEQYYEPMDSIRRVMARNPDLSEEETAEIKFRLSPRGIELGEEYAGDMVWIEFKLRPPVVTKVPYAAETTYAADDVVYDDEEDTPNECYRSLRSANTGNAPANNPLWWERQHLPGMFTRYVAKGVYADWLRTHGDGQATADRESARAAAELDRLALVHRPMQRQFESVNVQTHP